MGQQSKRTRAPVPLEVPSPAPHLVPPAGPQVVLRPPHPVLPSTFPSTHGPGAWIPPLPPQSVAASSSPCWLAGPQQPCWAPAAGVGGSASPWYRPESTNDTDPQAWGLDSHPPGGFLSFFKNTPSPTQAMSNGISPHPIIVDDDTNGDDGARTEKRLLWITEEDRRLVSAWLNNSNDPIQSNYRKNDQYWKEVATVYNSTTPKNRHRLVKQVKDRFGRIKKRVAWFCASWKEANALYASGESDVDLKKRAKQIYEADHKQDGPFMFEHCWEFLKKEPKWDAYLERLEDLEPDKRKYSVDDEVGNHFTLDEAQDERPIGGKQAKEERKRKRKDTDCTIDLEDELSKFVEAQNAANERSQRDVRDTKACVQ